MIAKPGGKGRRLSAFQVFPDSFKKRVDDKPLVREQLDLDSNQQIIRCEKEEETPGNFYRGLAVAVNRDNRLRSIQEVEEPDFS